MCFILVRHIQKETVTVNLFLIDFCYFLIRPNTGKRNSYILQPNIADKTYMCFIQLMMRVQLNFQIINRGKKSHETVILRNTFTINNSFFQSDSNIGSFSNFVTRLFMNLQKRMIPVYRATHCQSIALQAKSFSTKVLD